MESSFRLATYGVLAVATAGCSSTMRQIEGAELAILQASIAESKNTLKDLRTGSIPPDFDIQISLKMSVVNQVLAGVTPTTFPLPNDPSIKVTIGEIRLSTFGALPTASIKAEAKKGAISANIEVTAVLIPKEGGAPGEMTIKILSFVPKMKWYIFELTKSNFIRAILSAEANKITDQMPTVRLPVEEAISLGSIGRTETLRVQTSSRPSYLTMSVSYPPTEQKYMLKVRRYVFLKSEVHVFGVLE